MNWVRLGEVWLELFVAVVGMMLYSGVPQVCAVGKVVLFEVCCVCCCRTNLYNHTSHKNNNDGFSRTLTNILDIVPFQCQTPPSIDSGRIEGSLPHD